MKGEIKMKKILFTIAIVMTMALCASAQRGTDGFFTNTDNNTYREGDDFNGVLFPSHNTTEDPNAAPLNSGLLVLTALGAGYAVARKKK